MGFKKLETFKIVRLNNMVSRVILEPNALLAKTLKGMYFEHGEFKNTKNGSWASWGWLSLLVGRYVIRDEGF